MHYFPNCLRPSVHNRCKWIINRTYAFSSFLSHLPKKQQRRGYLVDINNTCFFQKSKFIRKMIFLFSTTVTAHLYHMIRWKAGYNRVNYSSWLRGHDLAAILVIICLIVSVCLLGHSSALSPCSSLETETGNLEFSFQTSSVIPPGLRSITIP